MTFAYVEKSEYSYDINTFCHYAKLRFKLAFPMF
jgi:hypothetical protein